MPGEKETLANDLDFACIRQSAKFCAITHSRSRTVIIWRINGNLTTEHCVSTSRVPCADISLSDCISRLGEGIKISSKIRIHFFLHACSVVRDPYNPEPSPVCLFVCNRCQEIHNEAAQLRVFAV